MIDAALLGVASALWLGILTSISPCPLASNIAAVSFIGKQFTSAPRVAVSGVFYVLGRMLAYLGLGMALIAGILSAPQLSVFLQKYMNKILGPVLILVGMVLLELLRFNLSGGGVGERMQERAGKGGVCGAGLLGSLIPLSVKDGSSVLYPVMFGAKSISALYRKLTRVELWARRVTGAIFIAAGVYYSLAFIFEVV